MKVLFAIIALCYFVYLWREFSQAKPQEKLIMIGVLCVMAITVKAF